MYLAAKDRKVRSSQIQVGILQPSANANKICQVTSEPVTIVGLKPVSQLGIKERFNIRGSNYSCSEL